MLSLTPRVVMRASCKPSSLCSTSGRTASACGDQVLDGPMASCAGHLEVVGGDDAGVDDIGPVEAAAGEDDFEDGLLLQYLGFGVGDVLLRGFHFGFGLDDVDGGDGAQLGAALVVVVEAGIELEGLLLAL